MIPSINCLHVKINFFHSKFNYEMDELLRIDLLEIIRTKLPYVREKLNE